LNYTRYESGEVAVRNSSFQLVDVLENCVANHFIATSTKRLQFFYFLDKNLPSIVETDQICLQQIIHHILRNAVKFTETGHVSLFASCSGECPEFPGSVRLILRIEDSGPGIRPELQKLLFDKFCRLQSTRSE
jgi:signal transduction histidine kinase